MPIYRGEEIQPLNEMWDILNRQFSGTFKLGDFVQAAGDAITAAQATGDAALPKAGGAMTGDIAMGANKITGLAAGAAGTDAVNLAQLPNYLNVAVGAEAAHKRILSGTLFDSEGNAVAASSNCVMELFCDNPPSALAMEAAGGTELSVDIVSKHAFIAFQTAADGTFAVGLTMPAGANDVAFNVSALGATAYVGYTTFD